MIRLDGISKIFPGVKSLDKVSFESVSGEVHALLGENGAGKSTLIKTISGAYIPDEGTIYFDGQKRKWSSPKEARDAGIHIIYQELVLFHELSVAENIFIGEAPLTRFGTIDYKAMYERADETLDRLGHHIDVQALLKSLSVADQQMVEIAKALVGQTKLLVLDEPTAVISGREAELLFERVKLLRDEGVCIIYISHRLEEIFSIADRVTVLKDGQLIGTRNIEELDRDQLVGMMVGRELKDIFPPKRIPSLEASRPVLTVRNLCAPPKVKDVSFDLYAGEILGIAGLVGAGRSEVAHAVFGSMPRSSGTVTLGSEDFNTPSPRESINRGLGFLTEDRKGEGLMMLLDTSANISAPALQEFTTATGLDRAHEIQVAKDEIDRFRIAVPGPESDVSKLSGGNQQKVLFGRWTRACRRVLILDEPTRGIDVGAKVEIYEIIRQLANDGLGILLISSELAEIVGLCTRVLVMRDGLITGEVEGSQIIEEAIMKYAIAKRESLALDIARH
ncbi:MAG: sugar ABC transporter ATP-binding protein [Gammaproteobacteria bacterium]|nr:sugar ABC transporter ATP-binding protein [Gammaproteobacteria bacterium]MCY4312529.1 sugar ABC transporter ATP-binding protein [Gammaproteobacteria bacterium]